MPAGSRPRKRTAATAAASTGDPATITSPLCSNSASAPSSAGQVSHVESSTGSGAGSGSDTAPQQQQQQQSPVGQRAADHIQQDDAEGAPPKRKRGRPRKLVYFVSNTNILKHVSIFLPPWERSWMDECSLSPSLVVANSESHADDEDREYEKLRKINHNVIERRRRDQINQSITELAEMLPMSIHQGAALNKLNTLKLSVDFVRQLTAQNQDLLVERQVMRTMLQERGVDWKTVEVAIAEHRAQMSASAAEQQAQQHLEYQHQSGLPRLLPSTDGGRVAVAASKVQAQQLQQQQQHSVGAESAGSATQSDVGARSNGAMGTVEQQQPGHFTPTTTTGL
ncbi:hypothetical protein BCR44DRAFT_1461315 [Catenaria anguillulae PL171]|uniref:BHLH domain-containing protein n=1 Tax=Catenaria anguillulae PL171 TaxID=765915 RepID=A0A1Y2HPG9_9FUNG|nr:hypothetical protein BCR44DRAFT_1461315 [Catenaria anguillulae PL171]